MAREARLAAEKRQKRNRLIRNVAIAVVIFAGGVFLINRITGGSSKKSDQNSTTSTTVPGKKVTLTGFTPDPNKNYTATVDTSMGKIVMALDTKDNPKATGRFIELARAKFYDGLTFHRVVKDFMIQGGDPAGDGTGNSGNPPVVGAVPAQKGYPIGAVAAAKTEQDKAGTFDSQFFIVTGSQGANLPNIYGNLGTVKSGQAVADKISNLPVNGDAPKDKPKIVKVTISES